MLRLKAALVLFVVSILLPAELRAQSNAGSITGYAFDQTGMPLKGIKLTASSPTQIGGSKVAYTNDEGYFRILQLFPGTFELRATAPKMRTYVQKDIKVSITATAELNIVMEVESSAVEEVKVVEKAPLVSTTTSNVKESYDNDFLESLPMNSRDQVQTQMVNEVAGAVNGRVRGGGSNQTLFMQDGFELNQTQGVYPVLKSSAAFEINSAGYGADGPTAAGGMINLVTRSGSNKTEFEFNATADMDQLRFFQDSRDARAPQYYYILAPLLSGPIIKDKVWYMVTDEWHFIQKGRSPDPENYFPDPQTYRKFIHKGTLKLTWQINSRNKLVSLTDLEFPITEHNMRDGVGITLDAQQNRLARRLFTGLTWEALLTDNLIFRAQAAVLDIPQTYYPTSCVSDPTNCNFIPSITNLYPRQQYYQNNDNNQRLDLNSIQFVNTLQWFPQTKFLGEHSLTLRERFYSEADTTRQSHPGDRLYELNGSVPSALTTYYSDDPRYDQGRFGWFISTATIYKHTITASDQWRPTRFLTLTPSISQVFATGDNSRGDKLINAYAITPGVAVAWDASHDGRTVLRGSVSKYVDADILAVAQHTAGTMASRKCNWNTTTNDGNPFNDANYNQNCVFAGGLTTNTFGSPCGPTGKNADGTDCHQALQLPRTWEYTVGGEREVSQGLALSLDFIYRKFSNQFEASETNRIWNDNGTDLARFGSYRNGRAEQILDMSTPDGAYRVYKAASFAVNKREGRLKMHMSYTLSSLNGTVLSGSSNLYGDIPARDVFLNGPLADDHRHEIKASAQWQATRWLTMGARYDYLSGMPYSRVFYNDNTKAYDVYRAQQGSNPGTNLNDPADDRPLRLPDLQDVNVQVRINMLPIIGQQLDFYVDVLNVLGLRPATAVTTNDVNGRFGTETAWVQPFRVRLGLNYRY